MKKLSVIAALIASAGLSNLAHATDGNIEMTGKLINETCKINGTTPSGTSVATIAIPLGTITVATFTSAGKTGPITTGTGSTANINLTNCPIGPNGFQTVSLQLDGTSTGGIDSATTDVPPFLVALGFGVRGLI